MKDIGQLAYKTERAASRKLARRLGISEDDALLRTLALAAGAAGIDVLLARRRALLEADLARRQARAERQVAAAERRRSRDAGTTPWRAWFDGSARPNPGRCTIGGVLLGPGGTRIELSQDAGYGNSGEAEYRALIAVLEAAIAAGADGLTVYGDSKVVIDDITGPLHDAAPALAPLRSRVSELLARCGQTHLRWIPRHRNPEADALSQRAAAA